MVSQWTDAADSARQIEWTRQLWGKVQPHISGSAYVNHLAGDDKPEKVRASYGPGVRPPGRGQQKFDPRNMLRLNAQHQPAVSRPSRRSPH